jgi:hypothetical protein
MMMHTEKERIRILFIGILVFLAGCIVPEGNLMNLPYKKVHREGREKFWNISGVSNKTIRMTLRPVSLRLSAML